MRFLGEINGQGAAEKFVAYLLTENIDTHIELARADSDQWEVWVRDEDRLDRARDELESFLSNGSDPKYSSAITQARKIIEDKERERREATKNFKRVEHNQKRLMSGGRMPPLTLALFIACILIGFLTNFSSPRGASEIGKTILEQFRFVTLEDFNESGGNPAASIMKGQIWRVITPILLHGGIFHLAMNMFMFVSLGRLVERWVGTPRFALMVLVLAVVPNLVQGLSPEWLHGTPFFVGISGVLYGFFGYVWIRSSINPTHGVSIPLPFVVILVGLIVVGLSGLVPNWQFADLCHLGGLVVGCGLGFAAEQGVG